MNNFLKKLLIRFTTNKPDLDSKKYKLKDEVYIFDNYSREIIFRKCFISKITNDIDRGIKYTVNHRCGCFGISHDIEVTENQMFKTKEEALEYVKNIILNIEE